jgi:hypothetical protein
MTESKAQERFIEQNTLDAAEYLDCAGRHSLREWKKNIGLLRSE